MKSMTRPSRAELSLLMAVTLYQIHIATNLAMNNRIYDKIGS
jgi:hypothetical protein